MAFYDSEQDGSNFVIHFGKRPKEHFCIFARGYARAAKTLADSLLERHFGDHEAYPVVYLYRHAVELYLKGLIVTGLHLDALTEGKLLEKLQFDHPLTPLSAAVSRILSSSFPNDEALSSLLDKIGRIARELDQIDSGSFTFRYPVNTKGQPMLPKPLIVNLRSFVNTLEDLLPDLEAIELEVAVNVDAANEILDSLFNLEQSLPSN